MLLLTEYFTHTRRIRSHTHTHTHNYSLHVCVAIAICMYDMLNVTILRHMSVKRIWLNSTVARALLQEHCCKNTHGCGSKLASTDPCHHKYTNIHILTYTLTFAAMSSRSPQNLKLRHTGFRNVTSFHSQDLGREQWGVQGNIYGP